MKKKVTIDISPLIHKQLEGYAKSKDLSVAAVIRLALFDYVEKLGLPAPNIVSTTERPRELSPRKPMTEVDHAKVAADWAD